MLNKEARILKISDIKSIAERESKSLKTEIEWKDQLEVMTVCKIPLDCLIYNEVNGRILSRTKSLSVQNKKIDAEDDDDKKLIEDLLWKSSESENETTLMNIHQLGQQKIGIITKDGIVIDGNRRLMLLNELKTKRHTSKAGKLSKSYDYFKAVVLQVTQEEDPEAIEKLETTYQLGEDQKVDYNPINLYLKIKNQYESLAQESYPKSNEIKNNIKQVNKAAIKEIYNRTGNYKTINKEADIEFILAVLNTMDDYLEYAEYDGIYLALDGREEQLRGLTMWLKNFYGEESLRVFDGYEDKDVEHLEQVCYDLIRVKLKNTHFRYIGGGQRGNHFFGDEEIWKIFRDEHFRYSNEAKNNEYGINYNAEDLESHINSRDANFAKNIKQDVDDNIDDCYSRLKNEQHHNEPEKLISKAKDALIAVNAKAESFSRKDAQNELKEVLEQASNLLSNSNTSLILERLLESLQDIDIDALSQEDTDSRLQTIKKINSLSFAMKKQLGG